MEEVKERKPRIRFGALSPKYIRCRFMPRPETDHGSHREPEGEELYRTRQKISNVFAFNRNFQTALAARPFPNPRFGREVWVPFRQRYLEGAIEDKNHRWAQKRITDKTGQTKGRNTSERMKKSHNSQQKGEG